MRDACEEGQWVERCAARICELEPVLIHGNVGAVAHLLWDRPRCCALGPEIAAQFLLEQASVDRS